MRMKQILKILLIAVLIFPFITFNNTSKAAKPEKEPTLVLQGAASKNMMWTGTSAEIQFQSNTNNGSKEGYEMVSITSSNSSVVSVDSKASGETFFAGVTAGKAGTITITAKYKYFGDQYTVSMPITVRVREDSPVDEDEDSEGEEAEEAEESQEGTETDENSNAEEAVTAPIFGKPYFLIDGRIASAAIIEPGKKVTVQMMTLEHDYACLIKSIKSSNEETAKIQYNDLDPSNFWIIAGKKNSTTVKVTYVRNGVEGEAQITIVVANDLSEINDWNAGFEKEIRELLRVKKAYESIDFAGYDSILKSKGYASMTLENGLKDLGSKLRGIGGTTKDIVTPEEYLKQKGAVAITEEYLQKFDKMVKDPIRPPDSATEAEFKAYNDLIKVKEAKKQVVINNRTIVRQLLQKVNDRANSLNYKSEEKFDMDTTLWDTAVKFLSSPEDTISGEKLTNGIITIGNWMTSLAIIIFPILTAAMGMRYLTADSQGKGKLKTQMVGLLISTGVAFGAFIIWKIMYQIMNSIIK